VNNNSAKASRAVLPGTCAASNLVTSSNVQGRPLPVPGKEQRGTRAAEGTLRWLCAAYFAAPEYRRLDPNTQIVRRRVIESCLLEPLEPGSSLIMADCPLDRISGKHIKMLRDRKAEVPEAANTRLKALRGLFKWALVDPDLASRFPAGINPARDVPPFRARQRHRPPKTLASLVGHECEFCADLDGKNKP
jgi:hypothetical protein